MKTFRIFFRNIRDGFKSVVRNFSLSLASISCISITLVIVGIALIASYNVENVANLIRDDFTIVTFAKVGVNEETLDNMKNQIQKIENVESVTIETKDMVANEMKETSQKLGNIINSWDNNSNPLYDTLLVKVINSEDISKTAQAIKTIENVEDVNYGAGMVEQLLGAFKVVEKIMIIAVVALVLVTLFLITNTIKITIFSRKREIEIMRLVGASNFSIKQPFVIEGLCLGVLGSLIPIIVVLYGYSALFRHFNGEFFSPFIKLVPAEPFIYVISLVLLALGIIVGMFGSYNAVRKYLKI